MVHSEIRVVSVAEMMGSVSRLQGRVCMFGVEMTERRMAKSAMIKQRNVAAHGRFSLGRSWKEEPSAAERGQFAEVTTSC